MLLHCLLSSSFKVAVFDQRRFPVEQIKREPRSVEKHNTLYRRSVLGEKVVRKMPQYPEDEVSLPLSRATAARLHPPEDEEPAAANRPLEPKFVVSAD